MKQVASNVTNSGWNTFWWILGAICMPMTTPYIVNKAISLLKFRKNRDSLTGKVSSLEIHCANIVESNVGLKGSRPADSPNSSINLCVTNNG